MNSWKRKGAPGSVNRLKKSLMLSGLKGRSSWVTSRMPPAVSEVCVCDLSTHLVLNVSLFHLARQNLLGVLRFPVNVLPCVTIKSWLTVKLWPPYILRNVHVVSSVKEPLNPGTFLLLVSFGSWLILVYFHFRLLAWSSSGLP